MLLANYFFMSETLISSLSALQNSIHLNRDTTRSQDSQDVKECFTNSVSLQNPTSNPWVFPTRYSVMASAANLY
jgi:hypothetical protein